MTPRPRALGVYIFAGGFTLGVQEHFNVLAHWEDGPFGVATARRNWPHLPIHSDVNNWPITATQQESRLDLIYGNPPCAPWSAAGNVPHARVVARGGTKKYEVDSRVACVRKQFSLLEALKPTVWVWESVARAFTVGRAFVDELAAKANEQGYKVYHVRVDGAYCGLAQRRRRYFFVASKVELDFPHPGKLPARVDEAWNVDHATMMLDARYANTSPYGKEIMHWTLPGQSLHDGWQRRNAALNLTPEKNERGHVKGRPGFLSSRLAFDRHACTVVSGGNLTHPSEDRALTVMETQLLCGYPPSFRFSPSTGQAYAEISKAVMPPTAEWLARHLAAGIARNVPVDMDGTTQVEITYFKPAA